MLMRVVSTFQNKIIYNLSRNLMVNNGVVSTFQNKIIYNFSQLKLTLVMVVSTFQNKIIYNLCSVTDWNLVLYVFFHPFF